MTAGIQGPQAIRIVSAAIAGILRNMGHRYRVAIDTPEGGRARPVFLFSPSA